MFSDMKRSVQFAAFLAGAAGIYLGKVRPQLIRWGATDEEVAQEFPGSELIPGGKRSATMAVTLDAPPSKVWPWLAQMGTDRGGWYSWDRLDNWGHRSADAIHEEWQEVSLGDRFFGTTDGSQSWIVAGLEAERLLNLRISLDLKGLQYDPGKDRRPKNFSDSTWGFQLRELPGGQTRLVVSGYWAFAPAWLRPILSVLVLEPSHWIMQTCQFANLSRRVAAG